MIRASLQIVALLIVSSSTNLYAYKTSTHQDITIRGAELSIAYQEFINNFKFEDNTSRNLMALGSISEDEALRFRNHFYDPLDEIGLNVSGISIASSAPSWGLDNSSNEYSWVRAREYLYTATTGRNRAGQLVAPSSTDRDQYFQLMFRSLGQIVHLIQDMSQPSHVRNDPHASHYEPFGKIVKPFLNSSHLEEWARLHEDEVVDFAASVTTSKAIFTFEDAFETVSLFSNQNFFSDDTIFKDYQFPSEDETNYSVDFLPRGIGDIAQILAEDGQIYEVPYIIKTTGALTGIKLAQVGYFGARIHNFPIRNLAFQIDDEVAKENAQLLIPQAVSYSAGLLDYFFRGQMRVFGTQSGLVVQNASDEVMSFYDDPDTGEQVGSIEIYYDNVSGQRQLLANYDLPGPLDPNQGTPVIPFLSPGNNLVPDQYMVVFRGKLGAEEGAVIGQIFQRGIYYVGKENGIEKIYRINLDGSNRTLILDNDNPDLTFGKLSLSPTSTILAFTTDFPTSLPAIYLLDLVGGASTFLTVGDWPDWSPDGSLIALQKDTGRSASFIDMEIYTINPVTGVETLLTNSDFSRGVLNIGHPNWSPDGASLSVTDELFAGVKEDDCWNQFVIIVIPASGELTTGTRSCSQRPLAMDEFPVHDGAATWRPDGSELAFTRQRNMIDPLPLGTFLGDELYKLQIGTMAGQTKLTDSTGLDYKELTPDWSPDGRNIAISSNQDGNFDIWLVDPNGGGYITNLTESNTETDSFPAFGWAPE